MTTTTGGSGRTALTTATPERALPYPDPMTTAHPEVTIRAGRVRGRWRPGARTPDATAAFLGIPYARPTVGDLRFAAPTPPQAWEGVRDAAAYGATPQRGDAGTTLIPEPSVPGEATLNVNVFTPDPSPDAGLPVLVYIHGGGFTSGSPASPWYDGHTFARDGVVTVTLSYRLGFDGFGRIDGAPDNRGVRDWLLALEWVQENIEGFGGDPARVTIAGQSAGGGAVLTLLGMPAAQHLFHRVWSISGALADVERDRAEAIARRLARAAGVPATRDGFAGVPEERIFELQSTAATPYLSRIPSAGMLSMARGGLPYGPMVDGDLLPRPTIASMRSGVGGDKPLVLGAVDDEFSMLLTDKEGPLRRLPAGAGLAALRVPRRVRREYLAANVDVRERGTAAVLGRYVTDRLFRSEVVRVARARTSATADTWTYRFAWRSPVYDLAVHCLDVPFFFDCLSADAVTAIAGDAPPQRLADDVHAAAVGFMTGGDPGWRTCDSSGDPSRVFDDAPGAVEPGVAEERGAYAGAAPLVS